MKPLGRCAGATPAHPTPTRTIPAPSAVARASHNGLVGIGSNPSVRPPATPAVGGSAPRTRKTTRIVGRRTRMPQLYGALATELRRIGCRLERAARLERAKRE